jgi:site-specific DNA recombinase
MGSPASAPLSGVISEPVPVAFTGRTSTLYLQDPVASLRRQLRECEAKLPPGWFIAAHYWDIESGGMDIEQRGHGTAHEHLDVGIPRDGGLADLLAEAASPSPRFAAVICEDIERSGRDTYNALKLEKQLAAAGVPLFATDEPIDVAGINATTVLVRRVKQGVAEWFRLQIKEKCWKGLREHSLAGWNIGPAPYGYLAERVTHPVAFKAAQGRTKTRLILDPQRAPVVAQIYAWRTEDKLGITTITHRLNADPAAYPPAGDAGWTFAAVYNILANPKYTGYMVFGRRTSSGGHRRFAPPSQWLWSPEPAHPAIVTRQVWDAAQAMGAEHASSRDGTGLSTHPAARRTFLLRSRIRCRICKKRMCGIVRRSGAGSVNVREYVYYACQHDPANPRQAAAHPDHPRVISVREDHLLTAISEFFATRVFGPDRAALLAQTLPATAAEDAARRDQQAAALRKKLRKIDAAENAHAREIEQLAHLDANTAAISALRTRIIARFTELEEERAQLNTQLTDLDKTTPEAGDPALLGLLPILGDILTGAPTRLQQQLHAAFGLQIVYKRETHQVTIHAEITTSTPDALAAILTEHDRPQPAGTVATGEPTTKFSVSPRPPIQLKRHRAVKRHRTGGGVSGGYWRSR